MFMLLMNKWTPSDHSFPSEIIYVWFDVIVEHNIVNLILDYSFFFIFSKISTSERKQTISIVDDEHLHKGKGQFKVLIG